MTGEGITRRLLLAYAGTVGAANVIGTANAIRSVPATAKVFQIPVSFSSDGSTDYEIAAALTLPPENDRRSVAQVLVPGLTYGRYYYDFPYKSKRYSYVRQATDAGYPVLNIDRIGSGESSHPSAEHTTLAANAIVLQQVIQALRTGEIQGIDIHEVLLVGHGYGALAAVKHQAQYGAADALVLTGYTQQYAHLPNLPTWLAPSEPAPAHELPDTARLPAGYHTPVPGAHTPYYYETNTDPAVVAVDDRHRQPFTEAELETAPNVVDESFKITVPVLELVGDQDAVFCGANPCTAPLGATTTEPLLWPNAEFTMEVLPSVGHAIFLHKSASTAFSSIEAWTNELFSR